MTQDDKLKAVIDWYEANTQFKKQLQRYKEEATFWQGKYRIVKQENNALRKKLYPKKC